MPRFQYQAVNADEELVVGEIEADAVAQAIAQLEASGLFVQAIGFATAETKASLTLPKSTALKQTLPPIDDSRDERVLRVHLERACKRAQSLAPAFRAYAEEMPPGRRKRELAEFCRTLERGDVAGTAIALSTAPESWITLIGATADANDSASMLRRFIVESRQADEARRQWWTLLAYPLFLLGFAALVLVLLSYMVVPTFRSIFDDFGLQLPVLTAWTINVSKCITSGAPLLLIPLLLLIVAAAIKIGGPFLSECYGALFGHSASLARFAIATADLLAGGVDLPDALRIAGRTAMGRRLRWASQHLAPLLESGDIAAAQRWRHPVSATVLYAVTAEMPTPARIRLLQGIADCYVDRARSRASWSQGMLGPLTIVIIGFVVAFVALSLFLPLIKLINNLSG